MCTTADIVEETVEERPEEHVDQHDKVHGFHEWTIIVCDDWDAYPGMNYAD